MKISSSLAKLIDETLLHKAALSSRHQNLFAPKAIPILWFGNLNMYRRSDLKILTVAINPSNVEFEERAADGKVKTSLFRFPLAVGCSETNTLSLKRKTLLVEAWNQYFDNNPYEWFKRFMPVLKELDASFYTTDCVRNRVLHVDLVTPMATSKPWNKMGAARKDIIKDSKQRRLFQRTVSFLKPDLVVVSLGKNLFLQFFPKQQWASHRLLKQFPYGSSKRRSRLHGFMLEACSIVIFNFVFSNRHTTVSLAVSRTSKKLRLENGLIVSFVRESADWLVFALETYNIEG